jgi:glycosyltransferase involved in cell wall biosynthesis
MSRLRCVHQNRGTTASTDDSVTLDQNSGRLKLAVGIATIGRPAVVMELLNRLSVQTRIPDAIVVCAPNVADIKGIAEAHPHVTILIGPRGLPHQRNTILQHLRAFDVVVYFDDDFVPCASYLEKVESIMRKYPEVVVTTGSVLKDGILGPGLTFEAADDVLSSSSRALDTIDPLVDVFNAYGCNMGIRIAPAQVNGVAFDETLPLYGWLEDVDFSQQLVRFGRVVKSEATRGVHLGIKSGRQPGIKLGYSQIANPLYLMGKGTCSWRKGLAQIGRNLAANTIRSFWPEAWVDRRGRLFGNVRAILDLISGRLDPSRILSM